MTEKYQFPQEQWSYGLIDDMRGNQGKLTQRNLLTRPSVLPESEENRPVALRMRRAKFCEEVFSLRDALRSDLLSREEYKQKTSMLMSDLKNDDEIYFNFLNGIKSIFVDMGKLGEQKANYVDLSFKDTDFEKPPIVFIPGISNDVNGTGEFALELALRSKRRVIMFTYPESPQGKVTNKFAKAVLKSTHFEAHTEFFKSAINQVIGKESNFDICGVSAGSIMVSEICKDKNFTGRIRKINLIVPPGVTALNPLDIKRRLKMNSDSIDKIQEDGSVGRLMVINIKSLDRSKTEIKNSNLAFYFLTLKLARKYKWWEGLNNTKVIIARHDGITYGIKNVNKLRNNPNLSLEIIDGGHEIAAVNPKKVIEKMDL